MSPTAQTEITAALQRDATWLSSLAYRRVLVLMSATHEEIWAARGERA